MQGLWHDCKGGIIWIALTGQKLFCGTVTVGDAHGYYGSGLRPDVRSQTAQVFVTTPISAHAVSSRVEAQRRRVVLDLIFRRRWKMDDGRESGMDVRAGSFMVTDPCRRRISRFYHPLPGHGLLMAEISMLPSPGTRPAFPIMVLTKT